MARLLVSQPHTAGDSAAAFAEFFDRVTALQEGLAPGTRPDSGLAQHPVACTDNRLLDGPASARTAQEAEASCCVAGPHRDAALQQHKREENLRPGSVLAHLAQRVREMRHHQAGRGGRRASLVPARGSLLGTPPMSDFYTVKQELGRGHLGTVRLCRSRATHRRYACKTIPKSCLTTRRQVEEAATEILLLAQLQLQQGGGSSGAPAGMAQSFVGLVEVFDDAESVHLVLELGKGGDLLCHVALHAQPQGRLTEAEAAEMLRQLAAGLQVLHSSGYMHRDIKPENILICRPAPVAMRGCGPASSGSDVQFRIADMGLCARLGPQGKVQGRVGSPKYMAPEVVLGEEYGVEADVWSLGVVLFFALSGLQPFVGQCVEDVFEAICDAALDMSSHPWPTVVWEARDLVQAMLRRDPAQRIRLQEIPCHPWMRKHVRMKRFSANLQGLHTAGFQRLGSPLSAALLTS